MLNALRARLGKGRGGSGGTLDDLSQLRADLNDGSAGYKFIALDVRENLVLSGSTITGWAFAPQSMVAGAMTIAGSPQFDSAAQEVVFDGVDDRIYSGLLAALDLSGPWSIFVVGRFPSGSNDRFLASVVNSAGSQYLGASRSSISNNDAVQGEAQSTSFNFQITNVACGLLTRCAVLTKNGTNGYTVAVPNSGTKSGNVAGAWTSASYRLVVGSRTTTAGIFDGAIKAVILVNRQLTAGEIAQAVAWANVIHGAEIPAATSQTVTSVDVQPPSANLGIGLTRQLTAQVLDQNGSVMPGEAVTWASSDTNKATVNGSGVVTGVASGAVTITATSVTDGTKSDSCAITVLAAGAVTSARMSPPDFWSLTGDPTKQLTPRAFDANGIEVAGRTWINWTSSHPAVATVSGAGVVTIVAAGTPGTANYPCTITAEDQGTGQIATCKLYVDSTAYPNEPAGMTPASAAMPRHFDAKASAQGDNVGSEGWDSVEGTYPPISLVSGAATAVADPNDAPNARGSGNLRYHQMKYSNGFVAGRAPGLEQEQFTVQSKKTVYISMWYRLVANWQGHFSGTNKTFFIDWTNASLGQYGANFFVSAEGVGQNPLWHALRFQGGEAGQVPRLTPNLVPQSNPRYWVERGHWERWELVLYSGTPGLYDGTAEWWVNGVKIASYTGLNYKKAGTLGTAAQFKWQPIWGGGNETATFDMYQWLDEVYCSVK